MKFPPEPKTPYVLDKPQYKRIFDKLARFENKQIGEEDENLIKFFYSQLETDWENPLEEYVDELLKKYGN